VQIKKGYLVQVIAGLELAADHRAGKPDAHRKAVRVMEVGMHCDYFTEADF